MSIHGSPIPPGVKKLKDARDVEGLVNALKYQEDQRTQIAAANALGNIGDIGAVEPLITVLKTSKLEHTTRRDFEDFEYKETRDENEPLRAAAADALGLIGDIRAVDPLIETFKLSYQVSYQASLLQATAWALKKIGVPSVEPLISVMKENQGEGRKAAATILGQIGDPRAVEPLIVLLNEKAGGAIWWDKVVEALGQIGDTRAVEPLVAALKDFGHIQRLRQALTDALRKLGHTVDIEPPKPETARSKNEQSFERTGPPAVEGAMPSRRSSQFKPSQLNEKETRQFWEKTLELHGFYSRLERLTNTNRKYIKSEPGAFTNEERVDSFKSGVEKIENKFGFGVLIPDDFNEDPPKHMQAVIHALTLKMFEKELVGEGYFEMAARFHPEGYLNVSAFPDVGFRVKGMNDSIKIKDAMQMYNHLSATPSLQAEFMERVLLNIGSLLEMDYPEVFNLDSF